MTDVFDGYADKIQNHQKNVDEIIKALQSSNLGPGINNYVYIK